MHIEIDYNSFCNLYYKEAEKIADITIAESAKKHGAISKYIDIEFVKDLGVSYALEKVYYKYDIDHESRARITTFLSRVVHNCVLTELGKESTQVKDGKRDSSFLEFLQGQKAGSCGSVSDGFRDYIDTDGRYERKEDLIKNMLQCLKRLNPVDQVIVNCWMIYPKSEYTLRALDELGWEDTARKRNLVYGRFNKAIVKLHEMMEGSKDEYFELDDYGMKIPPEKGPKAKSIVDYNYIRRRRRAAKKTVTGKIDYSNLSRLLALNLQD